MANMIKKKHDDKWTTCSECGAIVKRDNLRRHIKHVHGKMIERSEEPSEKPLPEKQQLPRFSTKKIISVAIIALVVIAMALFFLLRTPSEEDRATTEGYVPKHGVGSESDNFWVNYPPNHPQSGQPVSHPQWVLDSLENNCVLLVIHRTGCDWCQPQADRVIELGNKYKNSLTFYDLDLTLGGDVENKGYEAITYDPDGYPHYIALTAIVTLIDNNGSVECCWHGWGGDMDKSELEGWVKDGIYYYHANGSE